MRSDDVNEREGERAARISAAIVESLGLPGDADAYLCGPTGFMVEMSADLVKAGIQASRIRTEIFGAAPSQTPGIASTPTRPPHAPPNQRADGQSVTFARSDLSTHWDSEYGSLLELAEACDVPVRWSCRTGVCHTCQTALIAGAVTYTPEPVDDPAEGSILICSAQPRDDIVLDL
jgi:ferredoxin